MTFLEKLNYLMDKNKLNKHTLSKACGIPYTTIDGWYKKGYEGLKLITLRKLSNFFGTSLDFWATDKISNDLDIDIETKEIIKSYTLLNSKDKELVKNLINTLVEKKK